MNKKITIFVLISLLIFTGCGCRKKQDNNENNTPKVNEEILKEKQVKELKIKNISMELTDNNTTTVFTIELENTSEKDVYIKTFNIYFKDKEGNWWCSYFGNDSQSHFREKIGFIRADFTSDGLVYPAKEQPFVDKKDRGTWENSWNKIWKEK
mgnify:CR=1 FL=1